VADFGERLQSFPIRDAVEADEGLGDGVFLDVEGQSEDPLDKAWPTARRERPDEGPEQVLPQGPEQGSLYTTPPAAWANRWLLSQL